MGLFRPNHSFSTLEALIDVYFLFNASGTNVLILNNDENARWKAVLPVFSAIVREAFALKNFGYIFRTALISAHAYSIYIKFGPGINMIN